MQQSTGVVLQQVPFGNPAAIPFIPSSPAITVGGVCVPQQPIYLPGPQGGFFTGMQAAPSVQIIPMTQPYTVPAGQPISPQSPGTADKKHVSHDPYAAAVESPVDMRASYSSANSSTTPLMAYTQQDFGMQPQVSLTSMTSATDASMDSFAMQEMAMYGNYPPLRQQGGSGYRASRNGGKQADTQFVPTHPVTLDELLEQSGNLVEMARTSHGSSFIQAALRPEADPANVQVIWNELQPFFTDLLLDAHGCYVIKSAMERMQPADLEQFIRVIACDEQLVFSMCTHSLHTRRVVQFILETMDNTFIVQVLINRCREVGTTQQGLHRDATGDGCGRGALPLGALRRSVLQPRRFLPRPIR